MFGSITHGSLRFARLVVAAAVAALVLGVVQLRSAAVDVYPRVAGGWAAGSAAFTGGAGVRRAYERWSGFHARSVAACAIDGQTGEVRRARLCPDTGEITAWVRGLPGPTRVVYEGGPTGFGLARGLAVAARSSGSSRRAGRRVASG